MSFTAASVDWGDVQEENLERKVRNHFREIVRRVGSLGLINDVESGMKGIIGCIDPPIRVSSGTSRFSTGGDVLR